MARYRMANADAAWLHMDRPSNLMVVNSVLWFDEQVDWETMRKVVQERLVDRYPRFRQRVVDGGLPRGGVFWEDVDDFDIDDHLHRVTLPAPGGLAELQRFVGEQMSVPLDRRLPLWREFLVDGYGGGCAVMTQMHHCIADGIALGRVLLSMTDEQPDAGIVLSDGPAEAGTRHGLIPVTALRDVAAAVLRQETAVLTHPGRLVDLAQQAVADARALGKLVLIPPDARTVLRRGTSGDKRAVWTPPLPLDAVKEAAHAHGGTVNDVLLAAVSGALRGYVRHYREAPRDIRAIVPFNLRPLDQPLPRDLGNKFGLVFLTLPVGVANPAERMRVMHERMGSIKDSPEGMVAYGVLSGIGLTPVQIEKLVVDFFTTKGTAVMTNVPGPRQQIYMAGTPLRGVIPWVPCSGGIGMGLSIFSYHNEVVLGLATDARSIPDPDRVLTLFRAELEQLRR